MEKDLVQIKLASGNEFICEVVEYPDENADNTTDFIIRSALSIVNGENEDGSMIFLFKPFLHYVDKTTQFISLAKSHVMTLNRPDKYLEDEYKRAWTEFERSSFERDEEYKEQEMLEVKALEDAIEDNVVKFESKTFH